MAQFHFTRNKNKVLKHSREGEENKQEKENRNVNVFSYIYSNTGSWEAHTNFLKFLKENYFQLYSNTCSLTPLGVP